MAVAKRRNLPGGQVFLCGGDLAPGPRGTDCPSPLHDWPLPAGYVDAGEVAARRLRKRWGNRRCSVCGVFGWTPGDDARQEDRRPPVVEVARG